jgi:hypothetical protein
VLFELKVGFSDFDGDPYCVLSFEEFQVPCQLLIGSKLVNIQNMCMKHGKYMCVTVPQMVLTFPVVLQSLLFEPLPSPSMHLPTTPSVGPIPSQMRTGIQSHMRSGIQS